MSINKYRDKTPLKKTIKFQNCQQFFIPMEFESQLTAIHKFKMYFVLFIYRQITKYAVYAWHLDKL